MNALSYFAKTAPYGRDSAGPPAGRIEREETAPGCLESRSGLQTIDLQWWGRSPTCHFRAFTTGRSQSSSRASGGAGWNGKIPHQSCHFRAFTRGGLRVAGRVPSRDRRERFPRRIRWRTSEPEHLALLGRCLSSEAAAFFLRWCVQSQIAHFQTLQQPPRVQ